jgi:hypothetical protein
MCPIGITGYDNKSIIGKEVAALKAFLGKEVNPLIGSDNRFNGIFTKNQSVPFSGSTTDLNLVLI